MRHNAIHFFGIHFLSLAILVGVHCPVRAEEAPTISGPEIRALEDLLRSIERLSDDPETLKKILPPGDGSSPSEGIPIDLAKAREFWSFRPLSNPVPPALPDNVTTGGVRSPVDAFVLARLNEEGLAPAPEADKRTLLRRTTFDLTGLPPTPDEIEDFLADDSPEAFERVVDGLLSSPRYGERWGRHWLDVVRYTDSFDSRAAVEQDVGESYRYRDWVVKAFNDDMPYDRFLRYQIAGDLLPPSDGGPPGFNREGIIATGLFAIGNWPGGDADKEKMVTDIVDDQVDVVTRGMLGLTMACARCHEHKFDPLTSEDYYGLAGIFFSSHILPGPGRKTEGSPVLRIPLAPPDELERRKAEEARIAELENGIDSIQNESLRRQTTESLPKTDTYLVAAHEYRTRTQAGEILSRDEFSRERGIEENALVGWLRYLGYENSRFLEKKVVDIHEKPGLHAWVGEGAASSLTLNTNDQELSYLTILHPARTAAVHPSPENAIAAAWLCPASGEYGVDGRVEDLDSTCGDGIGWDLALESGGTKRVLCRGGFINGGKEIFLNASGSESLASLSMEAGDVLTLSISPKGSHSCDTTLVDLSIASLGEERRTWNLAEDLLTDFHQSNPHSDSYGNIDTWSFLETKKADGGAGADLLAEWEKRIGRVALEPNPPTDPSETLRLAAAGVREHLLSFVGLDATGEAAVSGDPNLKIFHSLASEKSPLALPFDSGALPPEEAERWRELNVELAQTREKPRALLEYANGIQEGGVPNTEHAGVHDVRLHIRGRYDRLGEVVPRGFPTVLSWAKPSPIENGSGRLELARWVASASNPLTARVIANRIWGHHFGEGIVRTPGNFGAQGERPTHPELLDWLARELIESGWSIKSLHKRVLLSSTYRQSSKESKRGMEIDPDNRLLARQTRRRLEAEAIRDSLLQVSDRLDPAVGGPPFRELSTPRRTLYFKTVRSDRTSFNMLFDAADPTSVVNKRIDTTVAPQALFLLNDPFVLETARTLSEDLLEMDVEDEEKIRSLYARLYGRPAIPEEIEIGKSVVGGDGTNWTRYCQTLLCANEFIYVD